MHVNIHVSSVLLSSIKINNNHKPHDVFTQAVICVGNLSHTQNIGFIMNASVSNITQGQISQIYDLKHTLPKCPVYCGGPLHTDRCTILHSADYRNSSTEVINDHVGITFNDDIIHHINQGRGPRHWKVMLGFCMWQDGQLDAELMKGYWIEQDYNLTVWGNYKRRDKMWRRIIETSSQKHAKQFIDNVFNT